MSTEMSSSESLLNDFVGKHLTVSGLIQNIFHDLRILTIGDLYNLDINVVANLKGVGVKKVKEVQRLIDQARRLVSITRPSNIHPEIDLNIKERIFNENELLIYVPSILKTAFEQIKIFTIENLLSMDLSTLDHLPGWGDKKKVAARETKKLYARLAEVHSDDNVNVVGDLVPAEILPNTNTGRTLLEDFMAGQNGEILQGKALVEANDLRRLLQRVFRTVVNSKLIDELDWREVPLKVSARVESIADKYKLVTVKQISEFALNGCVVDPIKNIKTDVTREGNFGHSSLSSLREEVHNLYELGIENYRFGKACAPATLTECIARAIKELNFRQLEIVTSRCNGATLEETAQLHKLTKERVRQIVNKVFEKLKVYRICATNLLAKIKSDFPPGIIWSSEGINNLLSLEYSWHLDFLLQLTETGIERINPKIISRIPAKCVETLIWCLRMLTKSDDDFSIRQVSVISEVIEAFTKTFQSELAIARTLDDYANCELTTNDKRFLLGDDWLRVSVKSQIVEAGVNGIEFADIDTSGIITDPSILEDLLGTEAVRLQGDVFRRPGEIYKRADEVLQIVREAPGEVDVDYIKNRSSTKWYDSVLIGQYLVKLNEIVNIGSGLYVHIQKLDLCLQNVKEIASWGARILAGEIRAVDGNKLFELYRSSGMNHKITNAHQLVSIVAKHPDIRRLSNNLQIAHRASFDEFDLSLEKTDPDIAAQWHPTKNSSVTPADVRPNSFKKRWWKCEIGHEFEATPVYRTRFFRECIGCQSRWTLSKIRFFVSSLREHLDSFTPAELYIIFQQSGLLSTSGQARGFVRSLATGRFPSRELDKFIAGDESLVDQFLNDANLELAQVGVQAQNSDVKITAVASALELEEESINSNSDRLPTVNSKAALRALDCAILASTDAEAVDFLLASAKAKLWNHAYRDPEGAVQDVQISGQSEYAQRVRDDFLNEFREASNLQVPPGYTFKIHENLIQPNLMQRHVAIEIFKQKRFGNWSGTGAGKTLSAVLASRVCNAYLTIVWCPNSVVGDFKSGWSGEILRIFSDSDVAIKTWKPQWRRSSKHRYLIMNYEQLQLTDSESKLKQFLEMNQMDFIVIDEVHYAKQRYVDQLSQRKRLLQAMVSEAGRKNPELRVLGMSATPVINNLQEGRSLIEMITGVEQHDLPIKPTVPNCMRLHQQLARLGTRWRPDYDPSLIIETPEVDCDKWIDEIRSLGRTASPLEIEKILTQARLPHIIEALKRPGRALVYTHYVDEIAATLYDAISVVGHRVGFYTGDSKQGLEQFKSGEIDVLIGSSSVGTGVDGLQLVCDRLIINCLPWTNAEFEQLIGRIWRQGQLSKKVEVIIPLTVARVNGTRWSYCHSKYQRILYKKSISDAAVDGAVPEGNLRSPAQAQSDILAWLERLESGEELKVHRRPIAVPLNDCEVAVGERYARYGDFSTMNARWNNADSRITFERLHSNPEEWEQYHTLYRKIRESWSIVPYKEFIRWCNRREGYVIADFGCGEALVAKAVSDRHTIHSFDHIAINEFVIEGDMSKTNLDSQSVDVALFALSLMGKNFADYLREAHRILKIDGHLHIWESEARFDDVKRFSNSLERLGFQVFETKIMDAFVLIEGRKTERVMDDSVELRFRE